MLAGIAYLCRAYRIGATEPGQLGYQSVLAQLVAAVIGDGIFYYINHRLGAWPSSPCRPTPASPTSRDSVG